MRIHHERLCHQAFFHHDAECIIKCCIIIVCRTVLIRQLLYYSDSGASIGGLNVEKNKSLQTAVAFQVEGQTRNLNILTQKARCPQSMLKLQKAPKRRILYFYTKIKKIRDEKFGGNLTSMMFVKSSVKKNDE